MGHNVVMQVGGKAGKRICKWGLDMQEGLWAVKGWFSFMQGHANGLKCSMQVGC